MGELRGVEFLEFSLGSMTVAVAAGKPGTSAVDGSLGPAEVSRILKRSFASSRQILNTSSAFPAGGSSSPYGQWL